MKEIIIATNNSNKVKEFEKLFKNCKVLSLKDVDFNEDIIEDGITYEENALIKARVVSKKLNKVAIADDSGLEIRCMDNMPGVHSARYLGRDTSYKIKNNIILNKIRDVKDRYAKFICVLAVVFPNGEEKTYRGELEGSISYESKGENGFGYDPIFYVDRYKMTAAEMNPDLKNKISHRAKAMNLLLNDIEKGKICL